MESATPPLRHDNVHVDDGVEQSEPDQPVPQIQVPSVQVPPFLHVTPSHGSVVVGLHTLAATPAGQVHIPDGLLHVEPLTRHGLKVQATATHWRLSADAGAAAAADPVPDAAVVDCTRVLYVPDTKRAVLGTVHRYELAPALPA